MAARVNKGKPVERTFPGVMTFKPNDTLTFDLDRNLLYEELDVQLYGTLALAGYTAAPTIRSEHIENLISLFSLTGNAKQNGAQAVKLSAVDPAYLRFKQMCIEGTMPDRQAAGSANGSYDFYTSFTKYFGARGIAGISDAFYFDSRLMSSFGVLVNTRDINAMVKPGTGTGGTATLSNVELTFHARAWEGGVTAKSAPYVRETMRRLNVQNLPLLDADFPNMPTGNRINRQTFKGCVGDVDYAEPSDAFFTTTLRQEGAHIKTQDTGSGGSTQRFDMTYDHLVARDKVKYGVEAWPTGYATHEYSRNGSRNNVLDFTPATGVLSAKNILDLTPVNGQTNTLWAIDEELVS